MRRSRNRKNIMSKKQKKHCHAGGCAQEACGSAFQYGAGPHYGAGPQYGAGPHVDMGTQNSAANPYGAAPQYGAWAEAGFDPETGMPLGPYSGMGAGYGASNHHHQHSRQQAYAAADSASLLHGVSSFLPSRHTEQFLLGLVLGAGATWVLSDEELRGKLLKAGMKLYANVAGGFEEIKEQMADIRAEVEAERHGD
jgi:hypothetical protein